MGIERKPAKFVQKLVLTPIRAYLERRSDIVISQNDTPQMEPPYIILSNHVNNWDPLLINCYVSEPISFVAGDTLFRIPVLKGILNYFGAIPKMKFNSDPRTIRGVLKAKKYNRVIGIFPEGNRNWDGYTEPIIYATAKLVKLLDIPVVIATISGGHLSQPRWAESHRKGHISISLVKKWDKGAFTNESPEAIHQKLTASLAHDEMAWQSERQNSYKGRNLALYLEKLLFICPHCEVPAQLRSDDDLLQCQNCNYTVRYTLLGTLEQMTHPLRFSTTRDWNKWQLDFLEKTLLEPEWQLHWDKAMQDHVKLSSSVGKKPFKILSPGILMWDYKSLLLQSDNGQQYTFPLTDIDGLNIHHHHKLDFYHKSQLYRIEFYQPRTSAYKWMKAIQAVQKLKPQTH